MHLKLAKLICSSSLAKKPEAEAYREPPSGSKGHSNKVRQRKTFPERLGDLDLSFDSA